MTGTTGSAGIAGSANHFFIAGRFENARAPKIDGKWVVYDTHDDAIATDADGEPLAYATPREAREKADELNGQEHMRLQALAIGALTLPPLHRRRALGVLR